MKILIDPILREIVDQAYEEARLGRGSRILDRDRVFAEALIELEIAGDAMRYVNSKGQIAWKATPQLKDHLHDLQLDVEADCEPENV